MVVNPSPSHVCLSSAVYRRAPHLSFQLPVSPAADPMEQSHELPRAASASRLLLFLMVMRTVSLHERRGVVVLRGVDVLDGGPRLLAHKPLLACGAGDQGVTKEASQHHAGCRKGGSSMGAKGRCYRHGPRSCGSETRWGAIGRETRSRRLLRRRKRSGGTESGDGKHSSKGNGRGEGWR